MNEQDRNWLQDMLDVSRRALRHVSGRTRPMLDTDELFADGLIRTVQLIGEAANRISPETRQALPQIPWRLIIGMRNRIVHDYGNVNFDIVWKTATVQIPQLIVELEAILSTSDSST
ncbi:MAG: DUF86 domain-containing protein [Anaerolineae bacterium]|nr:DUF86 domain-containing protein [Anaerolineae bacterium]